MARARRRFERFLRVLVVVVTGLALVASVLTADGRSASAAEPTVPAVPDGKVQCGFGLFCGPLDLGAAPPTIGLQPWLRIVQPNTPDETTAGEVDSSVAWEALESEAKAAVAALYGVDNDRRIPEAAREDVIAFMFSRLVGLIQDRHDGIPIEPYEQAWLDHLADELQSKRVRDAQSSIAEHARWDADKCNYQPPAGYGFAPYNPLCVGLGGLIQPAPPSADQFTEFGAALVNSRVLGQADQAEMWNKISKVFTTVAVIAAGGVAAQLAANIAGATATTTGVFSKMFVHAGRAFFNGAEALTRIRAVASGAAGSLVAVIAVAAAVTAVGTWREIETQETLPRLQKRLQTAQTETPDLAFIFDGSKVVNRQDNPALTELFGVLFAETVPSFDSERLAASTPRPHDPQRDPWLRLRDGSESPTVTTTGWDTREQTTYLADGWFVTRATGGDWEWSPTLNYIDRSANRFTATINNGQFVTHDLTQRTLVVGNAFAEALPIRNGRPEVQVLVTDDLVAGSELTFEAIASDPDGDDVTVTWKLQPDDFFLTGPCLFLDGTVAPPSCSWPTKTGATVTERYDVAGVYSGSVEVQDAHGAASEQHFSFRVRPGTTTLTVDTPLAPVVEETGTVTLGGTFTPVGSLVGPAVRVDWGDGTSSQNIYPCFGSGPLTADGFCSNGANVLGTVTGTTPWLRTHVYDDPPPAGQAAYTVTITVADAVRTVRQTVTPLPLNVDGLLARDAAEGGTMRITGRVDNPSGDPFVLTLDAGDPSGPVNVRYPCAAGAPCPFLPSPPPDVPRGIFLCADPCTSRWFDVAAPATDDPQGADDRRTVIGEVRKLMTGYVDTETRTATVSNVAPTVTADPVSAVAVGEGLVLEARVTDPGVDDASLEVAWGDGAGGSAAFACFACTGPLDWTSDLSHTYTSAGSRTVSLRATDSDGVTSAPFELTVDVEAAANEPPVLAAPATPLAATEDEALAIDLGDFIVSDDATDVDDLTVDVTDPEHGTLTGSGFLRTYTPDADYAGSDSFDLTVTDQGSPPASSTVTVPIAVAPVVDDAVVELSGPTSAVEGSTKPFTFTVTGEGDADDAAADCGDHGSLVPDSLEATTSGGSFSCAFPDGPATTTVSVTGVGAALAGDTVDVTVANVGPTGQSVVTPTSRVVLPREVVKVSGSSVDPGDDVTVTVAWGDGATTALPARAPGAFEATHAYAVAGTYPVTVTVSDGDTSATQTHQVRVAGGAAAIELIARRLTEAPTTGLTAAQRGSRQQAVDQLIGPNGGAGVGASDQYATDPVAALAKIRTAVERLGSVPGPLAATSRTQLAALSRMVAVDALTSAVQRLAACTPRRPGCRQPDLRALAQAGQALAAGDLALARGNLAGAIASYRDATDRARRA